MAYTKDKMYNDDEQEQHGKDNQSFGDDLPKPITRKVPVTGGTPSTNAGTGRED